MNKFKVGEVVQLKSGGEKMTVADIDYGKEDKIRCEWFSEQNLRSSIFFPSMLIKIES